jgi:hypothetical protein
MGRIVEQVFNVDPVTGEKTPASEEDTKFFNETIERMKERSVLRKMPKEEREKRFGDLMKNMK